MRPRVSVSGLQVRRVGVPRIVFVDHCARMSGAQIALIRMLSAIEGIQPVVVLAEDGPLAPRLRAIGVPTHVLAMPEGAREVRRDRLTPRRLPLSTLVTTGRYVRRLSAYIRAVEPDIVHTNSMKAALYGGLAGRLTGLPVVWSIQERLATDYMPSAAVTLMRTAARVLPSGIVANSRSTLDTLEPTACPSFVIPPIAAVRDRTGPPSRVVRDGQALRVAMIGRIADWKGQDVFLKAFAAAFPAGHATAAIVGAPLFGEEDVAAGLKRLTRELGLESRVRFTGFTDDVAGILGETDVLVHASVIPEPFGQVIVEGMAAGVPVIATAGGGPSEIVTDGVDGLLCAPADPESMATCLRRLAADHDLRRRLAAAGPASAERYAPANLVPLWLGVYDTVLKGTSRRGGLGRILGDR